MAKKDSKTTEGDVKRTLTGTERATATPEKAAEGLRKSGKVKGPMGVGGKEEPSTTAKAKEPAKKMQPAKETKAEAGKKKASGSKSGTSAEKKKTTAKATAATAKKVDKKKEVETEAGEPKKLPKPKKALPEETSAKEKKKATTKATAATAKKAGAKKKSEVAESDKLPKSKKGVPKKTKKSEKTTAAGEVKSPGKKPLKTKTTTSVETTSVDTAARNTKTAAQAGLSEKPGKASLLSEYDVHLFREGKHYNLYKKLGSHLMDHEGTMGTYFAVWAPNAQEVSVIGEFNGWDRGANPMEVRHDESGIWEIFIPGVKKGYLYKYFIRSNNGYEVEKGDPFAFWWETPPNTASVVWDLDHTWNDIEWLQKRRDNAGKNNPVSVYEMHLGSWKRVPEDENRSMTYRELAEQLPEYLKEMGYTHVEFMPVMEHPFFGSWGYQVTGYFAPSSRFGTPQDFMFLIDELHRAGIGVILDWVPSHFPSDQHGLHYFDGTFLYEHEDPRKGFHPDWKSYIFNYGRNEVRSFLISNSLYWLDKFHVDGLRVDAVASMLYLDYSRKEGEWEPNELGGNENLEAISFLKEFNEVVYAEFPDAMTIAEESTAWPMVSRPTYMGGLGFGMKWMMGWMHDTLEYFQKDPIHRKHHQNTITFSTSYAFTENFMLPLSHDEVVYGKQALINKMPGDTWNKFANLRSLYGYMYAHPGTKLLFMGGEFGQTSEWGHDSSLDWHLLNEPYHRQLQDSLKVLNRLYSEEPALYEKAFDAEGFEWIDFQDAESSVISFLRKGFKSEDDILVVGNLTPVPRENYRIGVPAAGKWEEIFNSDDEVFGGSNVKNEKPVESDEVSIHNKEYSISLTLPPMSVIYLKRK